MQLETLNNLSEGVVFFGIDRRLRLHNPAFRQIWGLSEDQLIGEPGLEELQAATVPWIEANTEAEPDPRDPTQRRIRSGVLHWRDEKGYRLYLRPAAGRGNALPIPRHYRAYQSNT